MARVVRYKITELAGREGPVRGSLSPATNVFYGVNGSGKTTLLRILDSALSRDATRILLSPFRSAEVVIYSAKYKREFTYRLERPDALLGRSKARSLFANQPGWHGRQRSKWRRHEVAALFPEFQWSSDDHPVSTNAWTHKFLPTSRLFTLDRFESTSGGVSGKPDSDVDETYSELIQDAWRRAHSDIAIDVQQAQQQGLAAILRSALVGELPNSARSASVQRTDLSRVERYLKRQDNLRDLDLGAVMSRVETNDTVNAIVLGIEAIEERIDLLNAPVDKMKSAIARMFSGAKSLQFQRLGIHAVAGDEEEFSLSALSSGEKHLLRILVAALKDPGALLIDEPELSMHVDWQRQLVGCLRELSPETQLILATHSPEILASVEPEAVKSLS